MNLSTTLILLVTITLAPTHSLNFAVRFPVLLSGAFGLAKTMHVPVCASLLESLAFISMISLPTSLSNNSSLLNNLSLLKGKPNAESNVIPLTFVAAFPVDAVTNTDGWSRF